MYSNKLILTFLFGIVIIAAGCKTLVGGGWINGLEGGKANFGFTIKCVDTDLGPKAKGQLQYSDKSVGVTH